jgi:hypothetical protein
MKYLATLSPLSAPRDGPRPAPEYVSPGEKHLRKRLEKDLGTSVLIGKRSRESPSDSWHLDGAFNGLESHTEETLVVGLFLL